MADSIYSNIFDFNLYDILVGLFFFTIILIVFYRYASKMYAFDNSKAKVFKRILLIKLIASIFFAMYHQFIYKGGDTLQYFSNSIAMNQYFGFDLFGLFGKLIKINLSGDYEFLTQLNMVEDKYGYDSSLFAVLKIASIIGVFTGNSFYATSLFFSCISFFASWYHYNTLIKIYPNLNKALQLSILSVPSVLFWASGISKDSICISCVLIIFASLINLITLKVNILKNIIVVVFLLYAVYIIKSYIAFTIIPCILLWIALNYLKQIKNKDVRQILFPFVFISIVLLGAFFANRIASTDAKFSGKESFVEKARTQQANLQVAGSAYSLGTNSQNPLIVGLLGIVVSIFRPFIWEVSNPLMVLAFLESSLIMILFYFTFFKWGLGNAIGFLAKDSFILFTFAFTLIFASGVGASSGNFGTLLRYKIPCLPFLVSSLLIMFQKFTGSVNYIHQSALHRLLAKYFLGQIPPKRISKPFNANIA